jgi:hypothetical protein
MLRVTAVLAVLGACLAFSSCATTGGASSVAYANVGIQAKAERLPADKFEEQNRAYERAGEYYRKGRDKVLSGLEKRYPGFRADVMSGNEERIAAATGRLQQADVAAAYWAGAGWLGAFSLNPLDSTLLANVAGAPALLERVVALDPGYGHGGTYDLLLAWYASAPPDLGGSTERAEECYRESLRWSEGKLPGPYVAWAQSWCVPRQDLDGFVESLEAALALKPGAIKGTRTLTKITQKKARWLLDTRENYFLLWDSG